MDFAESIFNTQKKRHILTHSLYFPNIISNFVSASSVAVGVWTLVAISVERYYAICHPLRSLQWQTLSHAYRLIIAIWIGSLICMMPIAVLSQLQPTKQGNGKFYLKSNIRTYKKKIVTYTRCPEIIFVHFESSLYRHEIFVKTSTVYRKNAEKNEKMKY